MPIPERYWEIIVAIAAPSTPNFNTITKNKSNTILSIAEIAKNISKHNYIEYINNCEHKYYEDTIIHGLIITYLNSDFNEISIDKKSELFFLLTRMQDEVHRYAISFHKNVRSKSLFQSILDDVEGIGPKRKKELLKHFGSVKKLKEATLEQLEEVLPKEVAKNLFTVLQNTK